MRNLFLVHCKRYVYRWETRAVTLLNLLLAFIVVAAPPPESENRYAVFSACILISLCCTGAAVIIIELNNNSMGALRNYLIAGYSKECVFLSKYIAAALFSAAEGAVCILLPVLLPNPEAGEVTQRPKLFIATMLLMYVSVCCISMTVCLLSERPTIGCVIFIGVFAGLLTGGEKAADALDIPAYQFDVGMNNEVVRFENLEYVSSPKRDVYDQLLKLSPVQPVYEYKWDWSHENLAVRDASELYPEWIHYSEIEKCNHETRIARIRNHAERLVQFPYYQGAVLAAVCIAGTLIFKKRNLK